MKETTFILNEGCLPLSEPPETFYRTITVWLTKELHK